MGTIVRDYTYVDGKPAQPSHANANEDKLFAEINGNLDWDNIDGDLINDVNGILKLDGSARILLAQIPDTLTGKDADTLDGKEYAEIATEIDEDIATHKADASAHHAKTTDHGELGGLGDDDHIQYLKKSGGTMVGALTLHGAPTVDLHAATKKYVDDAFGAGVTDHGALTGLGDDDHAQYHNNARGDARYLKKNEDIDLGDHYLEASIIRSNQRDITLNPAYYDGKTFWRVYNKAADAWQGFGAEEFWINKNSLWFTGDHGELVGKDDDDHPQYMLKAPGYESGWDLIANNDTRTFTHSLDSTRLLFTIYVSDNSDGSDAFLWMPHRYVGDYDKLKIVDNDNVLITNNDGEARYFKMFVWKIPE